MLERKVKRRLTEKELYELMGEYHQLERWPHDADMALQELSAGKNRPARNVSHTASHAVTLQYHSNTN